MLYLTRQQVREIDRRAIEDYHIPGVVLMENAAASAAALAWRMLARRPGRALVVCGGGNNGGDGLAVARHLHNRGASVHIALCIEPMRYAGDALTNWQIVQAMNLPISPATPAAIAGIPADLIIDAIFGTGLTAPPRSPFGAVVGAIHGKNRPILAIDLPSGLDCDTGQPFGPSIRATQTLTFVARKVGFAIPASRQYTGRVTVGDIGCPLDLVRRIALQPDLSKPSAQADNPQP